MKTSNSSTGTHGQDESTSSLEAFLVSRSPLPDGARGLPTTDISGRRCLELSERLAPHGSWQRMFAGLLHGQAGWFSTRCALIWKVKATKSSRPFFQLLASRTARTSETECGLLLTPTAAETIEHPDKMWERSRKAGYRNGTRWSSLWSQVVYGDFLPTPIAWDGTGGGPRKMSDGKVTQGKGYSPRLKDLAAAGMLPTPTARCWNQGTEKERPEGQPTRRSELNHLVAQEIGRPSQLNPRFVAEMMGFPPNWTESPFLSGEKKA